MAQETTPEINPVNEICTTNGRGHIDQWRTYTEDEIGMEGVELTNTYTGVAMLTRKPGSAFDTSSFRAWAATRHSREAKSTLEIMRQIKEKGVDSDGKMRQLLGIGHTAPADMSRLQVYIDNVPVHVAHTLFHMSVQHGGQEKSTRFQKEFMDKLLALLRPNFPEDADEQVMVDIETEFQQIGMMALQNYEDLRDLLLEYFREYYKIDPENNKEMATLLSRALDCARIFLLQGQTTGVSVEASAREFSRIIALMKAYPGDYYVQLAEQLETLFAPPAKISERLGYTGEAAGLIRHTEENIVNIDNALALADFLETKTNLLERVPRITEFAGPRKQRVDLIPEEYHEMDRLIAQYILMSWPSMNFADVMEWIDEQDDETLALIGDIIWQDIDEHTELLTMGATTRTTVVFDSTLAVARDLTRHRGPSSRFEPMPAMHGMPMNFKTAMEVINMGYVIPIHVQELEISEAENMIENRMTELYTTITYFLQGVYDQFGDDIDYGFIQNILPLGHNMPIWMHMNPKASSYLPDRRVLPGGDNTYRMLAYEANQLLAATHPAMRGMKFTEDRKPNMRDRAEFLDRS